MRLVTLSLALILATQAANAANERWTTYQGNAHHTGFVDENLAVAATPVLRWSVVGQFQIPSQSGSLVRHMPSLAHGKTYSTTA